jgi:hypothetical protein
MAQAQKQDETQRVDFAEIGATGLNRFGGHVNEEFLRELQGARGMKIYREMSTNDAVVGAMLFAFEYLARQVTWNVRASSEDEGAKGAADFIWGAMNDMSFSWTDTLSEIFSMLIYGWSWFEVVFKRRQGDSLDPTKRSKFNDNKIAWRKWSIRSQDSLFRWVFDEDGGIQALQQIPPPDFQVLTIPIRKSLLFRTSVQKNNPEGFSMLRRAYRSWFFKKRIEEIEGIGIERDLAGLPQLIPPEGVDLFNPNDSQSVALLARAEKLVRNVRRDEQEGIVMPFGWEFKLLSTGGRRQFDTNAIIGRYNNQIALSVLADFILLGHEKVGSFALSDSKTHLFAVALGSFLDIISDIINTHAIPQLLRINGMEDQVAVPPELVHGDVESPDLTAIGDFVTKLSQAGIDLSDEAMDRHLRQVANFPDRPSEEGEGRKIEEEGALEEIASRIREMSDKINGFEQRINGQNGSSS